VYSLFLTVLDCVDGPFVLYEVGLGGGAVLFDLGGGAMCDYCDIIDD
jgi:hypothetical protein